jgi:DNA-binding protein YbaB
MEPTGADDWVSSYLRRAEETQAMAEEAKSKLAQVAAQLSSPDEAVTVTVNASGALQTLQFGSAAERMSRDQLAGSVLATAQRAQARAAQQVAAAMSPLIGQDRDAMDFLRRQIPGAEEPDDPEASGHADGPEPRDPR